MRAIDDEDVAFPDGTGLTGLPSPGRSDSRDRRPDNLPGQLTEQRSCSDSLVEGDIFPANSTGLVAC
jgi:hypothetical protein